MKIGVRYRIFPVIWYLTPIFLLLAAPQALAQYKCIDAKGKVTYSGEPCAAGEKRGAISRGAMSGGSAAPPAEESGGPDVRVVYYDIQGTSAEALSAAVKAKGPKGYGGLTGSRITYSFKSRRAGAGCGVASLDTELAITMTLPRWQQPAGATPPALAAQWQRYMTALRAHENGHVELARRTYAEIRQALLAATAPDCAALEAALRDRYDALAREGQRQNDEYDAKTDHGRTQGATF